MYRACTCIYSNTQDKYVNVCEIVKMHVCLHIRACMHVQCVSMYMSMYARAVCVYVYEHVCMCSVCTCVCVYVCMCMLACV